MTEDLITLPSGATAIVFDDTSDKVTIPGGAAVDNKTEVTWEFLIYWPSGASDAQVLWSKNGSSGGNYQIALLTTGALRLYRARTGADYWITNETITKNAWNHIQITWTVSPSNNPIFKINDCLCTIETRNVGSGNWPSDAGSMLLGSIGDTTYTFQGTIAVFRFHTVVLSNDALHTNWLADAWRCLIPPTPPIAVPSPNVTVAALAPEIATSSNITQVRVPNTRARAYRPIVSTGDITGYSTPLPDKANRNRCR